MEFVKNVRMLYLDSNNMKINRAYKTELDPNNVQRTLFLKAAGTARFAYNWGLARKINEYKTSKNVLYSIDLHRELVILKETDFSWMYGVSKWIPQIALQNLDKAFKNFFENGKKFPKFKSKRYGIGSFTLREPIKIYRKTIQLPRIGKVRLKESSYLPPNVRIHSATISECAGRWFVSILVEEEIEVSKNIGPIVGVDLGIKTFATISDGTTFENQKVLGLYQKKLKRQQREVSRRKKGSNNRIRSVKRLAKLYMQISNIRKDAIHKMTTILTKTKSVIVIEDLNPNNMVKNHKLAGSLMDASFGKFRRQLEYKSKWYGSKIIVADRFYPSSKICSRCGYIKEDLKLSDRTYICDECHLKIDRDLNAAINLKKLAVSSPESINACLRGKVTGSRIQCPSMIQELNPNRSVS